MFNQFVMRTSWVDWSIALASSKKLLVFSCSLEFGIKKSVRQGAWFDVYLNTLTWQTLKLDPKKLWIPRKLSPEREAFINSLLEHYQPTDANDVQEMLKNLLGDTLQGILKAETDQKLGYSKYDYQNKVTDDSRNGYS